ncbi:hypothetical protein B0T10DRAFT_463552 [Thelonectria olida]|uniref:Uncharacterized protein n=1 Tax=Thelonectria olida TaxID=1576542 RepID=A0A9P8VX25_9HYPO|nr:hypothetical protein B0T10DRAFT_463552 [Thelonectria olida]
MERVPEASARNRLRAPENKERNEPFHASLSSQPDGSPETTRHERSGIEELISQPLEGNSPNSDANKPVQNDSLRHLPRTEAIASFNIFPSSPKQFADFDFDMLFSNDAPVDSDIDQSSWQLVSGGVEACDGASEYQNSLHLQPSENPDPATLDLPVDLNIRPDLLVLQNHQILASESPKLRSPVDTWTLPLDLSCSSADRQGGFSLYQLPRIHNDSPENIALLFDRRICEVLSIKEDPTGNPWRTIVWPLAREHAALYHAVAAVSCYARWGNFHDSRKPIEPTCVDLHLAHFGPLPLPAMQSPMQHHPPSQPQTAAYWEEDLELNTLDGVHDNPSHHMDSSANSVSLPLSRRMLWDDWIGRLASRDY